MKTLMLCLTLASAIAAASPAGATSSIAALATTGASLYQPAYWAGPNTICHDTPGGRFCHPAFHRAWIPGHHNWHGFWIPGHWA